MYYFKVAEFGTKEPKNRSINLLKMNTGTLYRKEQMIMTFITFSLGFLEAFGHTVTHHPQSIMVQRLWQALKNFYAAQPLTSATVTLSDKWSECLRTSLGFPKKKNYLKK